MPQTLDHPETLEVGRLRRSFRVDRSKIDEEARTVEIAFSSEEPAPQWFGVEILDHDPRSIRLGRLNDGGPVLVEHSVGNHVGTVERAWVDKDRICRALVRFGKSKRAQEVFQDVIDAIKPHVSTDYLIYSMEFESEEDGVKTYRALDWEPYEISFVAIPADHTVGVGRSATPTDHKHTVQVTRSSTMPPEAPPAEPPKKKTQADPAEPTQASRSQTPPATPAPNEPTQASRAAHDLGGNEENQRVTEILELSRKFGAEDAGHQFIRERRSVADFKDHLLDSQASGMRQSRSDDGEIGMSENEREQYSITRLLRSLADPTDRKLRDEAGLEFEAAEAFEKQTGRSARGIFIPPDAMNHRRSTSVAARRDLNTGTNTQGGHLVDTVLDSANFIDLLRNSAAVMPRATLLTGLVGDLAIPRQTGSATAAWVAEGSSGTESQLALGQLSLTPNTITATTDITRRMLIQSSVDVEDLVRRDLAAIIALAIDQAAVNGSGTSNEPEGILNMSGIGSVALGTNGAAPTWDDLVDLETEVAIDNALMGSPDYLSNARVRGKLKRTLRTATYGEQMLLEGNEVNGYPFVLSNQVPSNLTKGTGTNLSAIIFGYLRTVHIGLWSGLDLLVDPYSQGRSGTVQVTAFQDADVAARHEEALSAITDAITT